MSTENVLLMDLNPPGGGPKRTMDYVDELLLETSRLIVTVEEGVMHGEVMPSKLAPTYLQELINNPELNEEDQSSSTTPFDSTNSRSFSELQSFRQKVQQEDRLSNIYKLRNNFSSRFDNRAWIHPHGTTNFDYQAIRKRRQVGLEQFKNRVRKENYMYLGRHPEIRGLISLFLKKLLTVQPPDPTEYLAEYFTTHLKNTSDLENVLKEEMKKLSRYHVSKMQASGKINIRPSTAVRSEASGEEWIPETDANYMKKLNIGALAVDFSMDQSCLLSVKKKVEEQQAEEELRRKKKKKKPHKYCGCRDWKLKKNRVDTPPTERRTTANSTLGNVDTLATSEEEDEYEDDEEEEIEENGIRLSDLEDGLLAPGDAERIASDLVHEFFDPEGGMYSGPHRSLGGMKNIQ